MDDDKDKRLAALGNEIKTLDRTMAKNATEAGHKLIEAKTLLKHGQWADWLRDHCELSERSARRYMQLARGKTAKVAVSRNRVRQKDEQRDPEAVSLALRFYESETSIRDMLEDDPELRAKATAIFGQPKTVGDFGAAMIDYIDGSREARPIRLADRARVH